MYGFSAQEKNLRCVARDYHINNIDYMGQDTTEERAQYITRNNELSQEFSFAHPTTKCLINNIFNTHFTGSSLWNLFNKATEMLEKSWNVSQRIMFALPSETHILTEKIYSRRPLFRTRRGPENLFKLAKVRIKQHSK